MTSPTRKEAECQDNPEGGKNHEYIFCHCHRKSYEEEIASLKALIVEKDKIIKDCLEYFDNKADIIFRDEDSKQIPNEEMKMVTILEEALSLTPESISSELERLKGENDYCKKWHSQDIFINHEKIVSDLRTQLEEAKLAIDKYITPRVCLKLDGQPPHSESCLCKLKEARAKLGGSK